MNSSEDASVKLSLLALAEYADSRGGNAIPGFPALAAMTSQSEKTCQRAFNQADGRWFTREAVKLAGKNWRAYKYTLTMPDGADTVTARSRRGADTMSGAKTPRCGPGEPKVWTFEAEGADTVSTVLESSNLGKQTRESSKRSHLLTWKQWKEQKPADEKLIPDDDPVFEFAYGAGIPDDFLLYAWRAFVFRYRDSDDLCGDWRARFRRSIQEDWFKLWRYDETMQDYVLTNAGMQMQKWETAADD